MVVVVVGMQQYVGSSSKKPATDGRSDETELEFPASRMGFVSRELVLPRTLPLMSRRPVGVCDRVYQQCDTWTGWRLACDVVLSIVEADGIVRKDSNTF